MRYLSWGEWVERHEPHEQSLESIFEAFQTRGRQPKSRVGRNHTIQRLMEQGIDVAIEYAIPCPARRHYIITAKE